MIITWAWMPGLPFSQCMLLWKVTTIWVIYYPGTNLKQFFGKLGKKILLTGQQLAIYECHQLFFQHENTCMMPNKWWIYFLTDYGLHNVTNRVVTHAVKSIGEKLVIVTHHRLTMFINYSLSQVLECYFL